MPFDLVNHNSIPLIKSGSQFGKLRVVRPIGGLRDIEVFYETGFRLNATLR